MELITTATNPGTAGDLVPVVDVPADRHPALVYLRRLGSDEARRVRRHLLDVVASTLTGGTCDHISLPWHLVRYQHAAAISAALAQRYAIHTANAGVSAMRAVLKEAWRLGYTDAEQYQRAIDVEPVRGETLPPGRALTVGELKALFEACAADTFPAGARDAALFAVLFGGGLRRSEAAALLVEHYSETDGTITVRRGKGRKDRVVPLPAGAQGFVRAWLDVRRPACGIEGPLLTPVGKGGKIAVRSMTAQAILLRVWRRAAEAGVKRFSPHDARRTFISWLLEHGADLATVQRLVGHASPTTTSCYDRRGEAAKRQAVDLIPFPAPRAAV